MNKIIAGIILALTVSVGAFGQTTVVSWNLDGQLGNESFVAPSSSMEHVTGLNITRGTGLTAQRANDSFSSLGWEDYSPTTNYVSFGFTVDEGFTADIDELWVRLRSSPTGPRLTGLFSSLDGFAEPLFINIHTGDVPVDLRIDLSGPEFDFVTGTIEFRFGALSTDSADHGAVDNRGSFRLKNLVNYDGSTSLEMRFTEGPVPTTVPEPSAFALMTGIIAAMLVCPVRRKRKPDDQ